MKQNIQQNVCFLLNLCIGANFLQISLIASVKAEGVSKIPSYILFYYTQVSLNKVKENTESKVLVTGCH